MIYGKAAMVWVLRNWQGGDPALQVAECKRLGLAHVSIKTVDGVTDRWEGTTKRQNADLLPETLAALREADVAVSGWSYTYGVRVAEEADKTIEVSGRLGITEHYIDAEKEYNKAGMGDEADLLSKRMAGEIRTVGLTSYRWPLTYQPAFPVRAFAPYMDAWAPQVYWLGDTRVNGGAIQLEMSYREYAKVRTLPFVPIAPTYRWNDWEASGAQLALFFEKAKALGCPGAMIYTLHHASEAQKRAIAEFEWGGEVGHPAEDLRAVAAELRRQADEIERIANEC